MIKHVSFDVWNTLITPNPAFAAARTKLLALALNMEPEHVKRCYTKVKAIADGNAEQHGEAFTTDEMYHLLYKSMGLTVSPGLHREIRLTVETLFTAYPPSVGTGVRELMSWLAERSITTSIGSNSNFAAIKTMEDFVALTKEPNHHVIIRPIKYILSRPVEELKAALPGFSDDIVFAMYYGCLAEGYYKIPSYQANFAILTADKERRSKMDR